MVESRKTITDQMLQNFENIAKQQKMKSDVSKFLGIRIDFNAGWKSTPKQKKVEVYQMWLDSGEDTKIFKQSLQDKRAGVAVMETQLGSDDSRSEKQSRMSKFGSETGEQMIEELKDTAVRMSDSGKKLIQGEVKKLENIVQKIQTSDFDADVIEKYFEDFHKDLGKKIQKMNEKDQQVLSDYYFNGDKRSTKSEKISIERMFEDLMQSHPKTISKFENVAASFTDTFRTIPSGKFVDPAFLKINMRRAKIYDRVKQMEKQQMLTASEHNKLLYKEATRNGGQHGADLAVIENKHGIEEYRIKYPSLDEMLNMSLVQQYAFDLAHKRHLTFVQSNLLKDILKSGGSIVMPNIEFLKEAYKNKQSRGEDYQKEFQEYQNALINQIGKQVSYNGEQQWKIDQSVPTQNFAAPALQQPLQKPTLIGVGEVLTGIDNMVDYISKLSGNLNQLQLSKYQQVDDIFSNSVVTKKEPTVFKPQPGMAFKLRELMC